MKILFATHNLGKLREVKQILSGVAEVEQLNDDYPEIQSDSLSLVAAEAVSKLAEKYGKPIVVDDSGLFIDALNGFPGVHSAPIHKQIGLSGILKLLSGVSDRSCSYQCCIGYCEPGKEPVTFLGVEKGTIASTERGSCGFGHDPIFIPEGSSKTYGELSDVEEKKQFRRKAVLQLVEYLKQNA